MPIYEYKCSSCGKVFEILQNLSAKPLQHCIHCRGLVKKIVSPASFQFKGSGWYITDYKKKKSGDDKAEGSTKTDKKDTKNVPAS